MSTKITDFTTKEPARHKGFRHLITEDQSIIDLAVDELLEMEEEVRRMFPNEEYFEINGKLADLHMELLAGLVTRVIDRGVPWEHLTGFLLDTIEGACDE